MRIIETEHGKFTDLYNESGVVVKTAEEVYEMYLKQLEKVNTTQEVKTLEELTKENEQLWDTVNLLLHKTGLIE